MNNIAAIVRAFGPEAALQVWDPAVEVELVGPAADGAGLQATLGKNQGRVAKRRASHGFFSGL